MQKQMQAQFAKQKELALANGAKASKATKTVIEGVKGAYKEVIDESKIPDQVKSQPGYADKLAAIKANPPSIVIGNDGSVSIKGPGQPEVSGFTSKIDGKPALVINVPKPQPGAPTKQFIELKVGDAGASIQLGQSTFKRA